jgi:PEP-CTERM motif
MMKHRMAFGAAAILAAVSAPALAAGNLVTNGGFETNFGFGQFNQTLPGASGGQNASHPGTTANDWTVTGTFNTSTYGFIFQNGHSFTNTDSTIGPTSQYQNSAGFSNLPLWAGTHSVPNGSGDGTSFYGVDSTFQPSALTQEIGGLTVGDTYTISFKYAAAQQLNFDGNSTDQWVVMLGGQTIATTTKIDLLSHQFSGWFTETATFTYDGVGSNPGLLSFVNNGQGGCNADFMGCLAPDPTGSGAPPFSLLDGVSLTGSAPEPSTWAMMFIGFGGLAYAGLRNRRREAVLAA